MFDKANKDGNRFVELAELQKYMTKTSGRKVSWRRAQWFFSAADADQDGKLDRHGTS